MQNIFLYYSLWRKNNIPNKGKIRWLLRNAIFTDN